MPPSGPTPPPTLQEPFIFSLSPDEGGPTTSKISEERQHAEEAVDDEAGQRVHQLSEDSAKEIGLGFAAERTIAEFLADASSSGDDSGIEDVDAHTARTVK